MRKRVNNNIKLGKTQAKISAFLLQKQKAREAFASNDIYALER